MVKAIVVVIKVRIIRDKKVVITLAIDAMKVVKILFINHKFKCIISRKYLYYVIVILILTKK